MDEFICKKTGSPGCTKSIEIWIPIYAPCMDSLPMRTFTVNLYKSTANVGKVCCIHGAVGYNLQWETKIRIYTIKSIKIASISQRELPAVRVGLKCWPMLEVSPACLLWMKVGVPWGLPRINRSDWLVILLYPTFTSLIFLDPLAWKCWWFLDHMFMTKHHPAQLILTLMSQWFSMVEGLRLRISWLAIYIVQLTSK